MLRKALTITLPLSLMAGCATTTPEPSGSVTYVEATKAPEPTPQPQIIEIAKPMPLPGQLRKVPEPTREKVSHAKPWTVIERANRAATQQPDPDGYFNAIMQYDYAEGALYKVYTAPLTLTDIQLQPGERIIGTPAAGDTVRWVLGINDSLEGANRRTHVLIKPTRPNLTTTLVINTNRRTYHLELKSFKQTYMAAVNWRYPHDELTMMRQQLNDQAAQEQLITATNVNLQRLNFGYDVSVESGSASWSPTRVFDDGQKVFIQFPRSMLYREAPALFVLSDEGATQLVNYRVKNDYYIVDRLFDRAELRVGEKSPSVVRIVRHGRERHANATPFDVLRTSY